MIGRVVLSLLALGGSAVAQSPPPDDAAALERGLEAYFAGDPQSAWFFWLGPAERGFAEAQFSLGNLYLRGEGVPKDAARAKVWFERAVEQGHARAQLNLALMIVAGESGPRDLVAAYVLAMRAVGQLAGDERRDARSAADLIHRYMSTSEAERARRVLLEGAGPRR
jgi:uncharacterized protein